jgi:hypothetical protein
MDDKHFSFVLSHNFGVDTELSSETLETLKKPKGAIKKREWFIKLASPAQKCISYK